MGTEWKPLDISSQKSEETKDLKPNLNSLSTSPEDLHVAFFEQAQHLTEAITNQNYISEISGKIPEHTNQSQKIISLESFANEFNGFVSSNSLSLPFKGINQNQINIEYTNIESNWAIKLSISHSKTDDEVIQRTFLLPKVANEPVANWNAEQLNITF
tara:strand:+ start:5893 stop:6366 length:474 start_codon:yes stop_codon:yes gene_type:complete